MGRGELLPFKRRIEMRFEKYLGEKKIRIPNTDKDIKATKMKKKKSIPNTDKDIKVGRNKYESRMSEGKLNEESAKYIDIYQGEHKSTLAYYENQAGSSWAMGNIPHNAPLTFNKKQVPTIIKLLKMKNSPLVKQD
jgi:hypothetical protein